MSGAAPGTTAARHSPPGGERLDRLHYLATGFALGELEEHELRELYEELRQPGEPGITAAKIAWQSLHHTLDLRTQMGSRFQDEVRSRIVDLAGGSTIAAASPGPGLNAGGFIGGVLARIGMRRPQLAEIGLPNQRQRQLRWPWVVGIAVLAAVAAMPLWWPQPVAPQTVHVLRLDAIGLATCEGSSLAREQAIELGRTISVAAPGEVVLGWSDSAGGGSVHLVGPAQAVMQADGLALSAGWCLITSTDQPRRVGTANMAITVAAHSRVVVRVDGRSSSLGCQAGSATWQREGRSFTLAKDQASDGDEPYLWVRSAQWNEQDGEHRLAAPAQARSWAWQVSARFGNKGDQIEWVHRSPSGAEQLRGSIANGVLRLSSSAGTTSLDLAEPPLAERRISIERHGEQCSLRVDGITVPIAVDDLPPPSAVRLGGQAVLSTSAFHVGPADAAPVTP